MVGIVWLILVGILSHHVGERIDQISKDGLKTTVDRVWNGEPDE